MEFGLPTLVFISLATACAIVSGLLSYQEIGEVNRKRPNDEQIPYLLMYPGKMSKVKAEYKRLYPTGRLDLSRTVLEVAMFVFLALAAVAGGFLR